ncbi:polyprenyl synthetase family protein [Acholeplasma granularum]|uniref:polyprenyl synthetase family protein n=1 Tax=Acholeplasma granularum TaxID=264635 RepID=UPI000471DB9D|nr:farnesyl diphosphate synthase [Acholeplasma granularum]
MTSLINKTLNDYINTLPEGKLKEAIFYALLGDGKRVRPLLAISLLQSKNIDPTPYLDVLCAVELIHTYSLIHDDLPAMDDDTLRRGKPTVHIKFDEATAILAGDALLTDSFYLVANSKVLSGDLKSKIIEILSKKSGSTGMVLGQIYDIESENKQIDINHLNKMYELKTSNLIQASLMIASAIAAPSKIDKFEQLGYYIGLIYQIQDDILEHTLTIEEFGKSKSDDIRNKPTYVSLIGLDKSKELLMSYSNLLSELFSELKLNNTLFDEQIKSLLNRKK